MRMWGLSLPVTNPTTITASIQIIIIDVMTMGQAEGKIHRGTVVADTLTTTTFKFKVTAKIAINAIIILISEITEAATMTLESGPGHVIASSQRKIVAVIVNHAHSIFILTIMISKWRSRTAMIHVRTCLNLIRKASTGKWLKIAAVGYKKTMSNFSEISLKKLRRT